MNDTVKEILHFWFEEIDPKKKYQKDPEFDQLITDKYESVFEDVVAGKTESWRETPEGRLAEIIVLDQFSRNMYRDSAKQFSGDELALKLAQEAVACGADMKIDEDRRGACYMPYMHSESKEVHKEALSLFEERAGEVMLKFEKKHKDIIDRFGRYPHRNEILGRESTPEEKEFNEEHGGF